MRQHYFRFKQFGISDEHSLMKTGSDSVMLGAWIQESPKRILDVGAGSGIISIMLAYKTEAQIDAVEIDTASSRQALENVNRCNLKDRISVYNMPFGSFVGDSMHKYDLIVTNPPYFTESLKSENSSKNLWRHNDSLTQGELINGVRHLLSEEGKFFIILPFSESGRFLDLSMQESLYLISRINIKPKTDKPVNRVMLKLSRKRKAEIDERDLTIRNFDQTYTKEYIDLTKDYYPGF